MKWEYLHVRNLQSLPSSNSHQGTNRNPPNFFKTKNAIHYQVARKEILEDN